MKSVLVFDVNETLLNLASFRPEFKRIFGDEAIISRWFAQLTQNSWIATITSTYQDFGELAVDALELLAKKQGVTLADDDGERIIQTMSSLKPHDDVVDGLEMLKEAGFRMAALTNSPYRILKPQLSNAGISKYFEQMLSVDEVKLFKPHRNVYEMGAEKLGITTGEMRMIACHNWDTTGAMRANCKAAFVARPGFALSKLDEQPDVVESVLTNVAAKIIAIES